MRTNKLMIGLFSGALALGGTFAEAKTAGRVLSAGQYSATVAALPCEACAPKVQETLGKAEGVESVTVDPKTKTVTFRVKEGNNVKISELQKSLKAASAEMGMGADYTLHDVKKTSQGRS